MTNKLSKDLEKILDMPNNILAHKLNIEHSSAKRLKSAVRELIYVTKVTENKITKIYPIK